MKKTYETPHADLFYLRAMTDILTASDEGEGGEGVPDTDDVINDPF